ncbi:hypothetical protein PV326_010507 [Microctonus aethiopoides]|nr:hypothetical protein PV326_010507 [Microctonus aethiopoides]
MTLLEHKLLSLLQREELDIGKGQHDCQDVSDDFFAAQIILSFASWDHNDVKEYIAIYYYNPGFKPGDKIGFHVNDTARIQPFTKYYYPSTMNGFVYFMDVDTSLLTYESQSIYQQQCLGYSASWIRNGTIRKTSCLSTHPDWMHQRRALLETESFLSILIPGTHNSGSYLKRPPETLIEKFTATQDGSILNQLIMGARYFDLRPGKQDNKYWIFHGDYLMTPLQQTIDDVIQFMNNTQEIVCLHFKEFPHGFETSKDHLKFIRYLRKQFEPHLLSTKSASWASTFKRIWNYNRRLIISYDHHIYPPIYKMWPPITQMWGNVQSIDELRSYLALAESKHVYPRASMAELTMDVHGVVTHAVAEAFGLDHTSLRKMGSSIGPYITQWYNEFFYHNASIVAVDYLNATGIVEVALEWNDRKFSPCYDSYVNLMEQNDIKNKFTIISG